MFRRSLAASLACALGCFAVAMTPVRAAAADIKLLGGASMRVLLRELLPQFGKSSGHQVTVEYGTLGAIADRVMNGEATDVVIVTGTTTWLAAMSTSPAATLAASSDSSEPARSGLSP